METPPERSGCTIDDIPEELIVEILSYLDVGDLNDAALVCKSWHRIVRTNPRLFVCLTIDSDFTIFEVLNAFRNAFKGQILPFSSLFMYSIDLKNLQDFWDIDWKHVKSISLQRTDNLDSEFLVRLLKKCENLESLEISFTGEFDPEKLDFSHAKLKDVTFQGMSIKEELIQRIREGCLSLRSIKVSQHRTTMELEKYESFNRLLKDFFMPEKFEKTCFIGFSVMEPIQPMLEPVLEEVSLRCGTESESPKVMTLKFFEQFIRRHNRLKVLRVAIRHPGNFVEEDEFLDAINKYLPELVDLHFPAKFSVNLVSNCTKLKIISIGSFKMVPREQQKPSRSILFPKLNQLFLVDDKSSYDMSAVETSFEAMPNLSLLDIVRPTNEILKLALRKYQRLQVLYLKNCSELTDDIIIRCGDNPTIGDLTSLQALAMANCCNLSEEAWLNCFEFRDMQRMYLGNVPNVSYKVIEAIARGCPSLEQLCVIGAVPKGFDRERARLRARAFAPRLQRLTCVPLGGPLAVLPRTKLYSDEALSTD